MLLQNAEEKKKWIILNGDVNSHIDWGNVKVKSISNLGDKNGLECIQDFPLHQHTQCFTRKKGLDDPWILHSLFIKQKDDMENIIYRSPVGMSDLYDCSITFWLLLM